MALPQRHAMLLVTDIGKEHREAIRVKVVMLLLAHWTLAPSQLGDHRRRTMGRSKRPQQLLTHGDQMNWAAWATDRDGSGSAYWYAQTVRFESA